MSAEGIVFQGASPVVVNYLSASLKRADALHPVILVCEAASGPAEHGDAEGFEGLQDIGPIAGDIGDIGVRTYPDAFVDASAQVFGKLAEQFCRDYWFAGGILVDACFYLCGRGKG